MKKNLLALFLVGAFININAQELGYITYIGDKAVVKIEPNTLFYSTGNLHIDSDVEGTVLNEGDIYTRFVFAKDISITSQPLPDAGKEFINVYNSYNSYGQLIVDEGLKGHMYTDGYLTIQRPAVSPSKIQYLNIGFPFQGLVDKMVAPFDVTFQGGCKINSRCATRYSETLLRWNNNNIVWDAVPSKEPLVPGSAYTLSLSENAQLKAYFEAAMNDPKKIVNYRGQINPAQFEKTATTKIPYYSTPEQFSTIQWKGWKERINPYREFYKSYVTTNGDDLSITAGKNIHQYANPFTSNISLFEPDAYVKIDGENTSANGHLISIAKFTTDAEVNWDESIGSNFSGEFQARQYSKDGNLTWVGNGEALLIRPTEKFTLNVLPKMTESDNKVYPVTFNFADGLKTFQQNPSVIAAAAAVSGSKKGKSSVSDFSQLEVFLTEPNGDYLGFPIYLAASTGFESGTVEDNDGLKNYSYFLQEDPNSEAPISNSETMINIIGDDYVAKPIYLGLTNDVASAKNYSFRFKLYEDNIFNAVESELSNGRKFFLEDTKTKKVVEIKNNQEYFFDLAQDDNFENRFAVYWKEYKGALGTGEVNKFKTVIYKNNNFEYFVRLNSAKKSVNIELYNINGQKIDDLKNVATTADYKLTSLNNLVGVYIVKLTYADGETVNTKVIVK